MKVSYRLLTIAAIFLSVLGYQYAHADTINQLSPWKVVNSYITTLNPLYGLNIPGLATSTTGCLSVSSTGWISANGSACGSGAGSTFPFTATSYGVSTSTTLGLLNGFISTASSTFTVTPILSTLATPAGTVLAVDANGKIIATTTSAGGVTSVSGTYPIVSSGGATPTISFSGISTSSAPSIGNLSYWTGTNTLGTVATSSLTFSGPFNGLSTLGALVGGSASTVTYYGLSTSTALTAGRLLYSGGTKDVTNVATTTLSVASPLNLPAGQGFLVGGANATIGWSGLATSSAIVAGNLLYGSGVAGVANVATTSVTCSTGASCTSFTTIGASPITITAPGVWPFTPLAYNGVANQSTTTPFWLKNTMIIASTTNFSFASSTNFEMTLYADNYPGADIGAKAVAAYAAGPSTGVHVYIPTGTYNFSTTMSFATNNKPIVLECGPNTYLNYTGSATSTVFNTGIGDAQYAVGIEGCNFTGPNDGTSVAVEAGGTNGAKFFYMRDVDITKFRIGLVTGNNAYEVTVDHSWFQYNSRHWVPQGTVNAGERMVFSNNVFADQAFTSDTAKCIYLPTSATASTLFTNNSIDDCGVYIEDGNLDTVFDGNHFENPDTSTYPQYNYISIAPTNNNGFANVKTSGNIFMNDGGDAPSSPNQFILNGGYLTMSGDTANDNGGFTIPALVNNVSAGSPTLNIFGFLDTGSPAAVTNTATSGVKFTQSSHNSGNTGIGTSSPISMLTVNGGVTLHGLATGAGSGSLCATADGLVSFNSGANCVAGAGSFAYPFTTGLSTYGTTTQATTTALWLNGGGIFASSTSLSPTLAITQSGAGPAATFMGGNVGIGTTSPGSTLSINGNGYFAGSINLDKFSGYKIEGSTVLYASSTNNITLGGIGAGAGIIAHATSTSVTSGVKSTAFGYQALSADSNTGYNNTAFGYQALINNTTGSNNIAIGASSLASNTTGTYNFAVGSALFANTTGVSNVAVGGGISANTIGNRNTGIGLNTLQSSITGNNNTAIGANALFSNTSATNTVAIGYQAGAGNFVNYFNQGGTAVGYQAGYSFQSSSDYNTLLGYQAGYNITTGSNNLLIGTATSSTAIANLTTGSQNILIGNNISLPSATANGQLNIGNFIYGTGFTGTDSTVSSASLGIGTTTPQWLLNSFSATAPQLALSAGAGASQWAFRNSNGTLYLATTTTAGTATSSVAALSINTNGQLTVPAISAGSGTNCLQVSTVGLITNTGAACGTAANTLANGLTATTTFYNGGVVFASSTGSGLLSQSAAASNFFWDETNKKLGIGTSTPWGLFSVQPSSGTQTAPAFVVASSTAGVGSQSADMVIDASGNVIFGSTTPAVANGIKAFTTFASNSGNDAYVNFSNVASGKAMVFQIQAASQYDHINFDSNGNFHWILGTIGSNTFDLWDDSGNGVPEFQVAQGATTTALGIDASNHINFGGVQNAPVVSSCGGSPSVRGNDTSGIITLGTADGTSCTLTFKSTFTNVPSCTVSIVMTAATTTALVADTSATALIVRWVTSNMTSGKKVAYNCFALPTSSL